MRRLFRILLNVAIVLSLVLNVTTVVFWGRSYSHHDWLWVVHRARVRDGIGYRDSDWGVNSGDGGLAIYYTKGRMIPEDPVTGPTYAPTSPWTVSARSQAMRLRPTSWKSAAAEGWVSAAWGFGLWRQSESGLYQPVRGEHWSGSHTQYAVAMPHWFVALVTALLPGWLAVRWSVRRRRRAKGLCHKCGYDLRATADRCPECGAVPNAKDARLPKPGG